MLSGFGWYILLIVSLRMEIALMFAIIIIIKKEICDTFATTPPFVRRIRVEEENLSEIKMWREIWHRLTTVSRFNLYRAVGL